MTPEEYYAKSTDLVISYSTFRTQFGSCLVASTDKGVCNVLFANTNADAIAELKSRWLLSKIVKKHEPSHAEVERIFENGSTDTKINVHLKGTDFQIRVWKALLTIPKSSTSTYGEIAKQLGDPKSSRAVGTAIGNNPIGYIIPCHRVLTTTGKIGGYRWGVERKKAMLGFEPSSQY